MAFSGCTGSATPGYSSALSQRQQNPAWLSFQAPQHTPGAANALQNSLLDEVLFNIHNAGKHFLEHSGHLPVHTKPYTPSHFPSETLNTLAASIN